MRIREVVSRTVVYKGEKLEGYTINTDGLVTGPSGKILKVNERGEVHIRFNNSSRRAKVESLLEETFTDKTSLLGDTAILVGKALTNATNEGRSKNVSKKEEFKPSLRGTSKLKWDYSEKVLEDAVSVYLTLDKSKFENGIPKTVRDDMLMDNLDPDSAEVDEKKIYTYTIRRIAQILSSSLQRAHYIDEIDKSEDELLFRLFGTNSMVTAERILSLNNYKRAFDWYLRLVEAILKHVPNSSVAVAENIGYSVKSICKLIKLLREGRSGI